MPLRQLWVDPNTGATFPTSWVIWRDEQLDLTSQTIGVTYRRYASIDCYSLGFAPVQVVGTQISGATYATFFAGPIASARLAYASTLISSTGSWYSGAPEFSGAVFF